MKSLPVHTNSSIACFRRCPREYLHSYIQLRRPRKKAHSLRFGSLFHLGLNAWWRCPSPDPIDRIGASHYAMREAASKCEIDPFDLVKAEELMIGYEARWGNFGARTLAVELRFKVDNGHFISAGSIDAVVEHNGVQHIVEHKTASQDISPLSDYWRNIVSMDPQVTTYLRGAREMGYNVKDCIYDVIHKVQIEPMKATPIDKRQYTKSGALYAKQREKDETPEEFRSRVSLDISERPSHYYCRQTVVRLENEHVEFMNDNFATDESIDEAHKHDLYPRHPGACVRYGRICDYHPVCSSVTSISNDSMFRTAAVPHEELV